MKHLLIIALCVFGYQSVYAQSAPIAENDTVSVCNGSAVATAVLSNDSDPEFDEFHITNLVSLPQNGTATLSGDTIYYTPNDGFRGQDQITYHICDTTNECTDAFLVWNVDTCGVVNTAPEANDDYVSVCAAGSVLVQPLLNDTDAENDSLAVVEIIGTPAHGTAQLTINVISYTADNVTAVVDSFQYVVCDYPVTLSVQQCDTAWIFFAIDSCPPNRAPVAQPDIVAGLEDFPFAMPFNPCDNDSDPDGDNITCTPSPIPPLPFNGPLNGTLSITGDVWRYFPNPNFNGIDGFTYKVCDDGVPSLCSYNVVAITIAPVNDPPVAQDDYFTVLEDSRTLLPVLSNDNDIDGDNLKIVVRTQPEHGTLELVNNQLYYTPAPNYHGTDAFRYQACDSSVCDYANAYITIVPVNDAPTPVTDSIKIMDNEQEQYIDITANDYDVEGDSFYVAATWGGTFVSSKLVTENGKTLVFIQKNDAKACGIDSVFYSVCDYANCDTGIVFITAVCPFADFMPEGFSPNGDGVNDVLVFSILDFFRPLQLIVFNRWGHPVYQSDDYNNDWDGRAQNIDQPLPDGTYFYTIQIPDGRKYSSMCVINR